MIGIKDKSKIRKIIYNVLFWSYGIGCLFLFISTLIYIWSKFGFVVEHKYLSSEMLKLFNFYIYLNIALFVIGFVLNMFIFNGEAKKIIDKEHYGKIAVIQSILFVVGILSLILTPLLLKGANLTFYNYKVKALYCLGYCSSFINTFFLFYLFSFFNVIAEDDSYNKAKPYVYRIDNLKYEEMIKLISKNIDNVTKKGEFLNSNYKIDYYIKSEEAEYVYAFIKLDEVSDEFLKLYSEERLISFLEHLYLKILDKKKKIKLMYYICVDKYNDNLKDLIDLSIYQDQHFCIVHTLIDIQNRDLYIGGVRDDKKENVSDYSVLKNKLEKTIFSIIEKK